MKRSLLLSVMFIAGIVGVLGFTAAEWIDHEQVETTLSAGTLDLTVGDGNTFDSGLYECVLDPGEDSTQFICEFSLKNEGSVPAEIWVLMDHEAESCVDAGGTPGEFCDDNADLTNNHVYVDEEVNGTNHGFWAVPWSNFEGALCQTVLSEPAGSHLVSWTSGGTDPKIIAPGEEVTFKYIFNLGGLDSYQTPPNYPKTALDNDQQGDQIKLIFHYTMLQAGAGTAGASAPCLTADLL